MAYEIVSSPAPVYGGQSTLSEANAQVDVGNEARRISGMQRVRSLAMLYAYDLNGRCCRRSPCVTLALRAHEERRGQRNIRSA